MPRLNIEPGATTFRLEMEPLTEFRDMANKRNSGSRIYTPLFGSGSPYSNNSAYGYFTLE